MRLPPILPPSSQNALAHVRAAFYHEEQAADFTAARVTLDAWLAARTRLAAALKSKARDLRVFFFKLQRQVNLSEAKRARVVQFF